MPQVINLVHGGKTPPVPHADLVELGYAATLYANAALQGALFAVNEILGSLKASGSLQEVGDRLASFEARQSAVRKEEFDSLEARYSV